jgi:uncharacterized protein (DUF58 family)
MASPTLTTAQVRGAADRLADAYPPLLVQSQRIANAVIQGAHGRRRSGPGADFWQYRPYSPGDSISRIDWRKTARAGDTLIRETEWAATNTCSCGQARPPAWISNPTLPTHPSATGPRSSL